MYSCITEDDDYGDVSTNVASCDEESGDGSDLDDLETRLYSQIHYEENMFQDGNIKELENSLDGSTTEKYDSTSDVPLNQITCGSQLLTDLCATSLPSTSCQVKRDQSSTRHSSSNNTPLREKCEHTAIVIDSSALSTDDNTEVGNRLLLTDRLGSNTERNMDDSITSECIVIGTTESEECSHSEPVDELKKGGVCKSSTDVNVVVNVISESSTSETSDSEDSSVVEISRPMEEFVSLISEAESQNDDISVHAKFGSESVVGRKREQCAKRKVGPGTDVDVESATLEEIHDSLEDCDWSSHPVARPVFIHMQGRYYQPRKCEKCDGKGHQSRNCPNKIPVCLQCGEKGHQARACLRPVCYNCHATGHTRIDCPEPRRSRWKKCNRCLMQGHKEIECPNRWRQFHLTTDLDEPVQGTNAENECVFCSNCGHEGHFYHDCIEDTMNGNQWETWPFVVGYNLEREVDSLLEWRDKDATNTTATSDRHSSAKGKSKKHQRRAYESEEPRNMLDVRRPPNKAKKRKWREYDQSTSEQPHVTPGMKRQKLEPHVKMKKKKNLQEDEAEGRHDRHVTMDGYDHLPKVVEQAYRETEQHRDTYQEQRKKKNKKKKKRKTDNLNEINTQKSSKKKVEQGNYTSKRGFRFSKNKKHDDQNYPRTSEVVVSNRNFRKEGNRSRNFPRSSTRSDGIWTYYENEKSKNTWGSRQRGYREDSHVTHRKNGHSIEGSSGPSGGGYRQGRKRKQKSKIFDRW